MLGDIAVLRPTSLSEVLKLLDPDGGTPAPEMIAGGTDLMVVLQTGQWTPSCVLDLWLVDELRGLKVLPSGALRIGALTTYRDMIRSQVVRSHCPALVESARTVGATQIQARGTLGGNVANASPAGDTLPVLLAQGTTVVLRSAASGERTVRFEHFYKGYRQPDIGPGEVITALEVEPLPPGGSSAFRKVGTRLAQAISKVVMSCVGSLDAEGRVASLRLAAGSVAPVPVRLVGAEQAAIGHRPQDVLDAVRDAARADVVPIDDVRSSADYRREITGRLAARMVAELTG